MYYNTVDSSLSHLSEADSYKPFASKLLAMAYLIVHSPRPMVKLLVHACYFDSYYPHIGTIKLEIYTPHFENLVFSSAKLISSSQVQVPWIFHSQNGKGVHLRDSLYFICKLRSTSPALAYRFTPIRSQTALSCVLEFQKLEKIWFVFQLYQRENLGIGA